jgi:hypothetical protein
MTEGGDDDSVEITPEMAEALRALCARRETMTDDAFADALSEVLEIPRVMVRILAKERFGLSRPSGRGLLCPAHRRFESSARFFPHPQTMRSWLAPPHPRDRPVLLKQLYGILAFGF